MGIPGGKNGEKLWGVEGSRGPKGEAGGTVGWKVSVDQNNRQETPIIQTKVDWKTAKRGGTAGGKFSVREGVRKLLGGGGGGETKQRRANGEKPRDSRRSRKKSQQKKKGRGEKGEVDPSPLVEKTRV